MFSGGPRFKRHRHRRQPTGKTTAIDRLHGYCTAPFLIPLNASSRLPSGILKSSIRSGRSSGSSFLKDCRLDEAHPFTLYPVNQYRGSLPTSACRCGGVGSYSWLQGRALADHPPIKRGATSLMAQFFGVRHWVCAMAKPRVVLSRIAQAVHETLQPVAAEELAIKDGLADLNIICYIGN